MDPSLLEALLFGILKQFLKSETDTPFHNKKLVNHVCTKRHFFIWKNKVNICNFVWVKLIIVCK